MVGAEANALPAGGRFRGMGGAVQGISGFGGAASRVLEHEARRVEALLRDESAPDGRCIAIGGGLCSPASQTVSAVFHKRSQ